MYLPLNLSTWFMFLILFLFGFNCWGVFFPTKFCFISFHRVKVRQLSLKINTVKVNSLQQKNNFGFIFFSSFQSQKANHSFCFATLQSTHTINISTWKIRWGRLHVISLPGCQHSSVIWDALKSPKYLHQASKTPTGNMLSSTAVPGDQLHDFREPLTALDTFTQECTKLRKHPSQSF